MAAKKKKPAAKKPAAKKPAAKKPAAKKPAEPKTATTRPTGDERTQEAPPTAKAPSAKPAVPVVAKPAEAATAKPRPTEPKPVASTTPPKVVAKPAAKAPVATRIVWHDLMTTDVGKARPFYAELLGWKTRSVDQPPLGETQRIDAGGVDVGSLVSLPTSEGIPSHWMPYVQVGDLDAVVQRARARGGHVPVPPTPLAGVGRFAVIADLRGAHISPLEVTTSRRTAGSTQPGHAGWNEVVSDDPEGTAAFFAEVFGWGTTKQEMGPLGNYTLFTAGDEQVAGCGRVTAGVQPQWITYWLVPNCDHALGRIRQLGGQVAGPAMDVPGIGRVAQAIDPTGALFAIFQQR